MSYLRGFLPWIAFSVVSSFAWQWAALLAVALGGYFLLKDRRAGVTADAQILDLGTIAYFAVLAGIAFTDPHSPLQGYDSALSSAWLALIAGVSLLVRRPFTLGIAKRRTAPELWDNPLFHHTSTVLSGVWAASFATSAVLTFLCETTGAGVLVRAVVQILGFVVPMAYTQYYVKRTRARGRAAAEATTQVIPVTGR